MEISNELIGKIAVVAIAAIMGAGSGFGGAGVREAGHSSEVSELKTEIKTLTKKLSSTSTDVALLRAQLAFYTTGVVDFSASIAPSAMMYEMDDVAEAVEDVSAPPDDE